MGTARVLREIKGKDLTYKAKLMQYEDDTYQAFWLQDESIYSEIWGEEEQALEELLYMIEEE